MEVITQNLVATTLAEDSGSILGVKDCFSIHTFRSSTLLTTFISFLAEHQAAIDIIY